MLDAFVICVLHAHERELSLSLFSLSRAAAAAREAAALVLRFCYNRFLFPSSFLTSRTCSSSSRSSQIIIQS